MTVQQLIGHLSGAPALSVVRLCTLNPQAFPAIDDEVASYSDALTTVQTITSACENVLCRAAVTTIYLTCEGA